MLNFIGLIGLISVIILCVVFLGLITVFVYWFNKLTDYILYLCDPKVNSEIPSVNYDELEDFISEIGEK